MLSTVSLLHFMLTIGFKNPEDSDSRQRSLSQMTRTMPSNWLCTMLSVRKGMCGLSLRQFGRTSLRWSLRFPRPTGQTSSATFRSTGRTSTFDASTRSTLLRVIPCMIPHSGSLGMRRWSSPRSKKSVQGYGSWFLRLDFRQEAPRGFDFLRGPSRQARPGSR